MLQASANFSACSRAVAKLPGFTVQRFNDSTIQRFNDFSRAALRRGRRAYPCCPRV